MVEVLGCIEAETLTLGDQDDSKATYAAKISSVERVIDWGRGTNEVRNLIRALSPHIGARTFHVGVEGPIKLWSARIPEEEEPKLAPGRIAVGDGKLLVGCGDGTLLLEKIQLPGGRALSAEEYLRGNTLTGQFTL